LLMAVSVISFVPRCGPMTGCRQYASPGGLIVCLIVHLCVNSMRLLLTNAWGSMVVVLVSPPGGLMHLKLVRYYTGVLFFSVFRLPLITHFLLEAEPERRRSYIFDRYGSMVEAARCVVFWRAGCGQAHIQSRHRAVVCGIHSVHTFGLLSLRCTFFLRLMLFCCFSNLLYV